MLEERRDDNHSGGVVTVEVCKLSQARYAVFLPHFELLKPQKEISRSFFLSCFQNYKKSRRTNGNFVHETVGGEDGCPP